MISTIILYLIKTVSKTALSRRLTQKIFHQNNYSNKSQCSYHNFTDVPFVENHQYTQSLRSNYVRGSSMAQNHSRAKIQSHNSALSRFNYLSSTQKLSKCNNVSCH